MRVQEANNKYDTTNVRWGIVRQKNLSNQLDSGTVVISQTTALNIEPYDLVKLTTEQNTVEYWLIASVDKDYVTYEAPYKFDYTVNLMSLTKFLETIQLPSMSITNIGQNRSIYSYIQRICDTYVLPQLSKYFNTVYYDFDTRFNMVCPEMTFTQTTARECLDSLVGIMGCCIKLECAADHLYVTFLDLNPSGTAIDSSIINSIKDTQSAQDYVTELEHNMNEVIGQNTLTEYVKLKGDGYVFNSDNAMAILSHKVYDISKVVVKSDVILRRIYNRYGVDMVDDEININGVDITDYIVTEEIFNTLSTPPISQNYQIKFTTTTGQETKEDVGIGVKNQNDCMYWNRGSQKICNFNLSALYQDIFSTENAMPNFCNACIEAWLEANWTNPGYDVANNFWIKNYDWTNVILEITYTPYISPRLKVEQKDDYGHLVTMSDNSTNTSTDIKSYLSASLEKNSKLGNKSKILTAKSDVVNSNYAPKLEVGQYWIDENGDKYILSTLEYSTYPASIIYKGTLTKNYINQNIFTSINREKRYYSLPDPSEVVERKEVIKEYYKVKNVADTTGLVLIPSSRFTIRPLFMSCRVTLEDNTQIFTALYADTVYGGNLVAHSASFVDNISYGTEADDLTNGGYKMTIKKYVDDNGEAKTFDFDFRIRNANNTTAQDAAMMADLAVGDLPLAAQTTTLTGSYHFDILKDAREKISFTVEKIIYSGADNVIVGNIAELFYNTSELIWVVLAYNNGGLMTTHDIQMSKASFLGGLWRNFFPQYTGTLYVRKNRYNTASTYLTIKNFAYMDYIVFLNATKRG